MAAIDWTMGKLARCVMAGCGCSDRLTLMQMPHINLLERTSSTLRAAAPYLGILLLPGGLLILCLLLVLNRRDAIGIPWR